jgi:hypothetical protein
MIHRAGLGKLSKDQTFFIDSEKCAEMDGKQSTTTYFKTFFFDLHLILFITGSTG